MADDVWKVFAPDEKTKSVTAEHFMVWVRFILAFHPHHLAVSYRENFAARIQECIGKLDPTMDKRDLAQIAADLDEEGAGSITKGKTYACCLPVYFTFLSVLSFLSTNCLRGQTSDSTLNSN